MVRQQVIVADKGSMIFRVFIRFSEVGQLNLEKDGGGKVEKIDLPESI